ncbi:MAG: hypothetical protein QM755_02355 [Luteolibacter sp.]
MRSDIPEDAFAVGEWGAGKLTADWKKVRWSAEGKFSDSGKFGVTFQGTGKDKVRVRNVTLYQNGKAVSTDPHEGGTGAVSTGNVWTLLFPNVTQAEGLEIEAEIASDAPAASTGVIYAKRIAAK